MKDRFHTDPLPILPATPQSLHGTTGTGAGTGTGTGAGTRSLCSIEPPSSPRLLLRLALGIVVLQHEGALDQVGQLTVVRVSPNMSLRKEKTRSAPAELGVMENTMLAAFAHVGNLRQLRRQKTRTDSVKLCMLSACSVGTWMVSWVCRKG